MRLNLKLSSGFTIIECLMSLSLSLVILASATEILIRAKKILNKLNEEHESILLAVTALEKMREDLEKAGAGLNLEVEVKDFKPIEAKNSYLLIFSKEKTIKIQENLALGTNSIKVAPDSELNSLLKKGRQIVIKNRQQGEMLTITSFFGNTMTISPALTYAYDCSESEILVLEKVEIYLDEKQSILRRKVNDGSGQPLLEETQQFETDYDQAKNLLSAKLIVGKTKEKAYDLVLFPKNLF
ncbi:MAG: hypothetical protein ACP5SQ_09040 [Candidatus Saccharicenans sp.]